jgi:molecular chaperone GrpE (heat shock protein)
MTEETGDEGAATPIQNLEARIEELIREVRRQGRAAVAAQAAAESCLERLADGQDRDEPPADDAHAEDAQQEETEWVHALLPVADAVDRVLAQARAMVERGRDRGEPTVSGLRPKARALLSMLGRAPREVPDRAGGPELQALAEGLRVLRAQLSTALESRGVTADRRVGVPVDPEVHRVVEMRAARPGERDDVVLEVVRPGYTARGRIVREAEVVAAASRRNDFESSE